MGARVVKHLFLSWAHADQRAKAALTAPLDGTRDLHSVDRHQIFAADGRAFTETRGHGRERFVLDLATAIRARVLADA